MKNLIIFLMIICNYYYTNAQVYTKDNNGGYKVTENIVYMNNYLPGRPQGAGISNVFGTLALVITTNETETYYDNNDGTSPMKMHIFAPQVVAGQNPINQPLQVIVFGSGNGFSSPWTSGITDQIPINLAKKGYIVVCPEYRIGIDLYDSDLAPRAIWRAVQDVRQTIKYCRNNLNTFANNNYYGSVAIQTNNMAINQKPLVYVGYSSGAFVGLHNLYFSNDNKPNFIGATNVEVLQFLRSEGAEITRPTIDLGTLDNPQGYGTISAAAPETSGQPNDPAVQDITVSISGAIGNTNYISNSENDTPKALLMIHHPLDGVVPYGYNFAYKNFYVFKDDSFNYPSVNGSFSIDDYFNITNSNKKPTIYNFLYTDINCNSNDCLQSDAEGPNFKLSGMALPFFTTWYHDPTELGSNISVMGAISSFIASSTTTLTNNVMINNLISARNSVGIKGGITGLTTQETAKSIEIFPNPVLGDIINITAIENNTAYRIINMRGQEVGSGKVENESINVAQLSQGTYSVELKTKNQRIVKRFIKQ